MAAFGGPSLLLPLFGLWPLKRPGAGLNNQNLERYLQFCIGATCVLALRRGTMTSVGGTPGLTRDDTPKNDATHEQEERHTAKT